MLKQNLRSGISSRRRGDACLNAQGRQPHGAAALAPPVDSLPTTFPNFVSTVGLRCARSIRGFFTRPRVTLGKPAGQKAYQLLVRTLGLAPKVIGVGRERVRTSAFFCFFFVSLILMSVSFLNGRSHA